MASQKDHEGRAPGSIYIPAETVLDSQFSFSNDGAIMIEIDPEEGVLKLKPAKPN